MSEQLEFIASKMRENSRFAVLKIAFDDAIFTDSTKLLYRYHVENHNRQILLDPYPNSGFDLLVLENTVFQTCFKTVFIDHGIKTEMLYYDPILKKMEPAAFSMTPRSSISKTPLMMANHIGIIDSGYRGNLLAAVRYLPGQTPPRCAEAKLPEELGWDHTDDVFVLEAKTRLFQVCHPSLCPIYVIITSESDLSTTSRGSGGFGSTGV